MCKKRVWGGRGRSVFADESCKLVWNASPSDDGWWWWFDVGLVGWDSRRLCEWWGCVEELRRKLDAPACARLPDQRVCRFLLLRCARLCTGSGAKAGWGRCLWILNIAPWVTPPPLMLVSFCMRMGWGRCRLLAFVARRREEKDVGLAWGWLGYAAGITSCRAGGSVFELRER